LSLFPPGRLVAVSVMNVVGLGLGLWQLHVLRRPGIRALFGKQPFAAPTTAVISLPPESMPERLPDRESATNRTRV